MRQGDAESPAPEFPRSRVKHPLPCQSAFGDLSPRAGILESLDTARISFFLFSVEGEEKMEDILART